MQTVQTANPTKTPATDLLKDPIYQEKASINPTGAATTNTTNNSKDATDKGVEAAPTENQEENIYILFYRHGMNPQCQKGFKLRGDLKAAVERAKTHCQKMGYRYIFVRPLVTNLEDDEKYKDTYGAII